MVTVFVVVFALIGVTTILLTRAASANGPIKGIAGKCLDNQSNVLKDGNPIQLYHCNNTAAQQWTVNSDGTIHLTDKYCLDVKYRGTTARTPVWLYTCNGTVAQQWKVGNNGSIVNPNSGLCLDDQWANTQDGNPIWVWGCNNTAAQKWTVPKAVSPPPTPTPTPPPAPTPAPGGGAGVQQTGSGITLFQNLSGSTFSKAVNSAGSGATVSLQPKTYTFSDFGDGTQTIARQNSAYGAKLAVKGLLGAGSKYTTIEMAANTSKKSGDVPPDGCTGGVGCPTNALSLIQMDAANSKVDGVTIQGTSQGHLYNGLRFESVANLTLSNSVISDIPGDSSSNPGETFAVNLNHASGTATISKVTINGGGVSAAGLAANSCSATLNINDFYASNLKYSAGIALWQQTGTVNIHNYSSQNNPRALGAERLGTTVNLYDPDWSTPAIGHDITYTPYSGYAGRINFYYSSASKVPSRKIVILTNTTSVKSTVHIYINGVEKTASNYVTWQGV